MPNAGGEGLEKIEDMIVRAAEIDGSTCARGKGCNRHCHIRPGQSR